MNRIVEVRYVSEAIPPEGPDDFSVTDAVAQIRVKFDDLVRISQRD